MGKCNLLGMNLYICVCVYNRCLEDVQCQIFFSVNYLALLNIVLLDRLVVVQHLRFLKFLVADALVMVYKSVLWDWRNSACNLLIPLRVVVILCSYLHTLHVYLNSILFLCYLQPIIFFSGLIFILSCYVNRCFTSGLFVSVLTTTTEYAHQFFLPQLCMRIGSYYHNCVCTSHSFHAGLTLHPSLSPAFQNPNKTL